MSTTAVASTPHSRSSLTPKKSSVNKKKKQEEKKSGSVSQTSSPSINELEILPKSSSTDTELSANTIISRKSEKYEKNCKYYSLGTCKKGETCPFAHDSSTILGETKPLDTESKSADNRNGESKHENSLKKCRFYSLGKCKKGDACPFTHDVSTVVCEPNGIQTYVPLDEAIDYGIYAVYAVEGEPVDIAEDSTAKLYNEMPPSEFQISSGALNSATFAETSSAVICAENNDVKENSKWPETPDNDCEKAPPSSVVGAVDAIPSPKESEATVSASGTVIVSKIENIPQESGVDEICVDEIPSPKESEGTVSASDTQTLQKISSSSTTKTSLHSVPQIKESATVKSTGTAPAPVFDNKEIQNTNSKSAVSRNSDNSIVFLAGAAVALVAIIGFVILKNRR